MDKNQHFSRLTATSNNKTKKTLTITEKEARDVHSINVTFSRLT